MVNSKAGTGKIPDEHGASYSVKKKVFKINKKPP
jgi:hypothetical protein